MREDLKGQNLTFTEIAKLVGENWQSLPPAEREVYEKQANAAKEEYHRQLSEYKKTPEYRKHAQYLVEFKEKQAKRDQGLSSRRWHGLTKTAQLTIDTDANKRSKIDPSRFRHESSSGSMGGSASSASSGGSTSTNGSVNHSLRNSRSSSERMPEPEPHHTRDRMGSISSIADSHKSMSPIMADAKFSPRTAKPADRGPRMTSSIPVRDGNIGIENGRQHLLPSLSDVLDSGLGKSSTPTAPDGGHYARPGMVPAGVSPVVAHPASMVDGNRSRHPMPPRPGGLPPMLHHEESSNGSSMSGASGSPSTAIFGRSPVEGSLPIHALLENRPTQGTLPTPNHMVAADRTVPALGPRGYGI